MSSKMADVQVDQRYVDLIRGLHDDKVVINEKKIDRLGTIDNDDHGFIDFPEFTFEPETAEDGLVYGPVLIGRNFKKFIHEMPRYINRNSALAGAWVGGLQRFIPFGIPERYRPEHADAIFKEYQMIQPGFGAMNHCGPDMQIGLKLGWPGLLEKVRYYRSFNAPEDTSFYDGEEMIVEGTMEWIRDLAELAEEKAAEEADAFLVSNYLEIARINRALLKRAPETFREACQLLAHFQTIDRMYFTGGALDRLDMILRPYYQKDIAEGRLTDSEAVWIIASLFFNDTHYSQLGGLTPDGKKDTVDHLSFVILEAMHQLKIPANIAVRVHEPVGADDHTDELMAKALQYTLQDGTGVDYSLEKGITEGYARNGYPEALGRMRAKVGCNWVALPGIEYPLQDVTRISMPMAMEHAMNDMRSEAEPDLNKLWDRYAYHLQRMIDAVKEGYDRHYEIMPEVMPEMVLNLFMHGPIERGINCSSGGVDILNFNIDGIGLATVADSFAAIQQRVVEEKRLTWEQLFECLDANFEGRERERLMLRNIKRFGNPESKAEVWAIRLRDLYVHLVHDETTPKYHFTLIPGLFSHGDIVRYGHQLGASANGRRAGEPISHSSEPDPGFAEGLESFSITLKAEATAKVQALHGNSAPLQLDIDSVFMKREGGLDALRALIHAHEQAGGTLINLNILSKEQLLEAHKDPKKFPDLVVRVTGYSAFFASLSREYRQQVVDRFLSEK